MAERHCKKRNGIGTVGESPLSHPLCIHCWHNKSGPVSLDPMSQRHDSTRSTDTQTHSPHTDSTHDSWPQRTDCLFSCDTMRYCATVQDCDYHPSAKQTQWTIQLNHHIDFDAVFFSFILARSLAFHSCRIVLIGQAVGIFHDRIENYSIIAMRLEERYHGPCGVFQLCLGHCCDCHKSFAWNIENASVSTFRSELVAVRGDWVIHPKGSALFSIVLPNNSNGLSVWQLLWFTQRRRRWKNHNKISILNFERVIFNWIEFVFMQIFIDRQRMEVVSRIIISNCRK